MKGLNEISNYKFCEMPVLIGGKEGLFAVWGNIVVDAEAAMPRAALDPEESVLSPARAPAVFHYPEVLAGLRAEADSGDRMVVLPLAVGIRRLLAAPRVLEDPVAVVEQIISKDGGGGGSNGSDVRGHLGLRSVPGDVVAGDPGRRVVAAVVIYAVPVGGRVGAAVLLLQPTSVLANNVLEVLVGVPA